MCGIGSGESVWYMCVFMEYALGVGSGHGKCVLYMKYMCYSSCVMYCSMRRIMYGL